MSGLASTIKKMETGFLEPFYSFLETGVNTINKATYIQLYDCVVDECDKNDRADAIHRYAKKILLEYCRDKMVANMITLKEDELLKAWLSAWDSFKIFTHSINKMFSYLNVYHLSNSNSRKIPDECLQVFKKECWTPLR